MTKLKRLRKNTISKAWRCSEHTLIAIANKAKAIAAPIIRSPALPGAGSPPNQANAVVARADGICPLDSD